ncbi:hypothetical protein NUW58_g1187 [Xylaria curta]|uniref:Uncharacterized protein n=2 Tax=Xylaria curta TaxID=42375 RepID=A0ACC1PMA2_9PEZI|nr:hypothetical protein NUW58_g1698 [Xylaria curta]KAJ2995736.1 hypothetical protein NUW58_g1187 [Xylaria curta]
MKIHNHILALTTALSLFPSDAVGGLARWQVIGIDTWQPSGRPGNSPDWYIHVNITNPDPTKTDPDPNIAQGKVYCQIVWLYPNVPYNQIKECEIVDTTGPTTWAWTVELLEADDDNPSPILNFDLRWRAASISSAATEEGVEIWTGIGQFEAFKNLQGACAASGFCSWWLNPASAPVLIDVIPVSCQGTVEEALHGINCD